MMMAAYFFLDKSTEMKIIFTNLLRDIVPKK